MALAALAAGCLGADVALAASAGQGRGLPSVAFHYGKAPPIASLRHFEHVVLEFDHVGADDLRRLGRAGVKSYAYVSVGELSRGRPLHRELPAALRLGRNAAFDSDIVDLRQPAWRQFLIDRWLLPLWQRTPRPDGFFLDTLDSYQAVARTPAERAAHEAGLVALLRAIHDRFPEARLLANRGFEVLPQVAPLLHGVVAESLFRGYRGGRYVEVPEEDRRWLLARLGEARDRYGLPVIAIDYAPAAARGLMRETARRIADLGITPYVTTVGLDRLGVGLVEPLPRRVLMLWNSEEQTAPEDRHKLPPGYRPGAPLSCAALAALDPIPDLAYSKVHRAAAVPLEYLGYALDYADVSGPLPTLPLAERYAGVVVWLGQELRRPAPYLALLRRALDDGLRVAFFDHLGFAPDAAWRQRLALAEPAAGVGRGPYRVLQSDGMMGFEAKVAARAQGFLPLRSMGAARRHLVLADAEGRRMDAVFTAPFGGMALHPYVLEESYPGTSRWLLDPFAFLQEALALLPLPAPDVTTEDGRRVLITHIDGDGFVSRAELPGAPLAGQVILERVLRRYRVPTTVSVIEGEVCGRADHRAPGGPCRYPEVAADRPGQPGAERIARAIFSLPHVEMASHTYSHPFDWQRLGCRGREGNMNGLFERPVLRPRDADPVAFLEEALRRDIAGSADYINGLGPGLGKRVRALLWSGNALPTEEALRQARLAGLVNLNGGESAPTREWGSLTALSPLARPVGGELQLFAPITNENIYTDLWRGPFYGFRRVTESFDLTERPRRLKPMNIYYHFYSGTKVAALRALEAAYEHAVRQNPKHLWVSEYAQRAADFYDVTLARTLDGSFGIRGQGRLRTLRLPPELGWPDRERSQGVTGVWALPQGRYVGLRGTGRELLVLGGRERLALRRRP